MSKEQNRAVESAVGRLRTFLEIALDAYEDLNDSLVKDQNIGRPGHFVTQARMALSEVAEDMENRRAE